MNLAEVYTQLADIAVQISNKTNEAQSIMEEIHILKAKERELQESIGLALKSEKVEKSVRTRTDPEDIKSVRQCAVAIMRKSNMWMPLNAVAEEVTQSYPNVDRGTVEQQIRALVNIPNSGIHHNGKRGLAAMYRWTE